MNRDPLIEGSFDAATGTISYLVADPETRACALIDSVLDFDPRSGRTSTTGADRIIGRIEALGLHLEWILETHVHADHLSAAPYVQQRLGGRIGIGSQLPSVQAVLGAIFDPGPDFAPDGRQFDHLFEDGEILRIGRLELRAIHTPGHTPACLSYLIDGGAQTIAFVGDTLFMPDCGTARCDFPGGDARTLFRSIRRILDLPAEARLYMCHDYPPAGRALRFWCTVAEQRAANIHVHDDIDEEQFVAMRSARDAELAAPLLMIPALQVNMCAGHLPPAQANGVRYLKTPIGIF